ncbi:MAG: hypothetical protein AB7R89_13885 [Dehalococcoidia bacterium]
MTATIAHERPSLTTPDPEPFTAELRVIRGRNEPVVVDRRTDCPEIICKSLAAAETLARHMNRDHAEHAAQVWP